MVSRLDPHAAKHSMPERWNAGQYARTCDEEGKWLRMDRGTISTICNLGEAERAFHIPRGAGVLLASRPIARSEEDAIVLPADTVAVLAA